MFGASCALRAESIPLERDFIIRTWRTENGLPDMRVLSLLVDRKGFLWAGTRKGVSRFDGRQFKTWSRSTHAAFVSEECQALAEDREGTIWVGTADGLIQLADTVTRFDVKSITPTLDRKQGHQQAIQTLCASDAGELLVGTFYGLVSRGADGSWQRIQDRSVGLELNCPGTALATMPDGTVWVGGSTHGLFRRQQIEAPWIKELSAPALAGEHFVRALAATRDGVLHAIVTYDTRFWQWPGRLLRRHAAGWEAVVDVEVETRTCTPFLTPDSAGGLWFSITNRVVGHWLNNTLHRYALPVGVVGQSFNCMAEDAEGNLWAGTARDGLVCLLPRRIKNLTAEDGLPEAKTRALLEASDGTFWVGTDGGVFQANREPRRVLNRASGLASDLVRALAEDAQVFYVGQPGNGPSSLSRRGSGPLSIAPLQRGFIEVQYTAIAFRSPDHVRFRHRLLGLSDDWVEAGSLRQASYANLRPGDYTFEVGAVNAHGYASATPAQLAFRIEPIWHERAAVRVAGVLLLAGLVADGRTATNR